MDEKESMLVKSILTEYVELRAEIRNSMQLQYTLLSLFITAMGIVFALIFKSNEDSIVNAIIMQSVGLCMIPGISAFCGAIWLDQVYRQIRIGSYIYKIEERINILLGSDKNGFPALYWEHCVNSENTNISRVRLKINYLNPNFIYYYIGLMVFICIPIVSWILVYYQNGISINIWSILGISFTICYVFLAVFIVWAIIRNRGVNHS